MPDAIQGLPCLTFTTGHFMHGCDPRATDGFGECTLMNHPRMKLHIIPSVRQYFQYDTSTRQIISLTQNSMFGEGTQECLTVLPTDLITFPTMDPCQEVYARPLFGGGAIYGTFHKGVESYVVLKEIPHILKT